MKKHEIISDFDCKAYKKIRKNVSNFIKRAASIYDKKSHVVLDIAPQQYNDVKNFFLQSSIETLDIEKGDDITYVADITKNNSEFIKGNKYDVVICTEVLEHTLNPFLAVEEIHRLLKKNGVLLLSVPFNFRIHGPLPDCWRFTEHGLKALLGKFEIVELKTIETKNRFLMPIHYTVIAKK